VIPHRYRSSDTRQAAYRRLLELWREEAEILTTFPDLTRRREKPLAAPRPEGGASQTPRVKYH